MVEWWPYHPVGIYASEQMVGMKTIESLVQRVIMFLLKCGAANAMRRYP